VLVPVTICTGELDTVRVVVPPELNIVVMFCIIELTLVLEFKSLVTTLLFVEVEVN
jgi:hypothetical protein